MNKFFAALAVIASLFGAPTAYAQEPATCEVSKITVLEKLEGAGFHQHRMFLNKAEINKIADVLNSHGLQLPEEYKQATDAAGFINMENGAVLLVFFKGPCVILGGRIGLDIYGEILSTVVAEDEAGA